MYKDTYEKVVNKENLKTYFKNYILDNISNDDRKIAEQRINSSLDNISIIMTPNNIEGLEVSCYIFKTCPSFNLHFLNDETLTLLTHLAHGLRDKNLTRIKKAEKIVTDTKNSQFFANLGFDQTKFFNKNNKLSKTSDEYKRFLSWLKNCPIEKINSEYNYLYIKKQQEKFDPFNAFLNNLKNNPTFNFIDFKKIKKNKSIKLALKNLFLSKPEHENLFNLETNTYVYPLNEIGFLHNGEQFRSYPELVDCLYSEINQFNNVSSETSPIMVDQKLKPAQDMSKFLNTSLNIFVDEHSKLRSRNALGSYNSTFNDQYITFIANENYDGSILIHELFHHFGNSIYLQKNHEYKGLNEIATHYLTQQCIKHNKEFGVKFDVPTGFFRNSYDRAIDLITPLLQILEKTIISDFTFKKHNIEFELGKHYVIKLNDILTNFLNFNFKKMLTEIEKNTGIKISTDAEFLENYTTIIKLVKNQNLYEDLQYYHKLINDLKELSTQLVEDLKYKRERCYY